MNIREAVQIYGGLVDLAKKDIPVVLGYRVGMMLAAMEAVWSNYEKGQAKLRHEYGLDQPEAVLRGIADDKGASLLPIDPAGYTDAYAKFVDGDAGVTLKPIALSELQALRDSKGEAIAGMGTIAAKLSPIIKENME